MGLTINNNLEAMNASRNLNNTENMLSQSMQRLSSGLRSTRLPTTSPATRSAKACRARSTASTRPAKTSRTLSRWHRPLRAR